MLVPLGEFVGGFRLGNSTGCANTGCITHVTVTLMTDETTATIILMKKLLTFPSIIHDDGGFRIIDDTPTHCHGNIEWLTNRTNYRKKTTRVLHGFGLNI